MQQHHKQHYTQLETLCNPSCAASHLRLKDPINCCQRVWLGDILFAKRELPLNSVDLSKDEVELRIGLVHFVAFQKTKVRSAK